MFLAYGWICTHQVTWYMTLLLQEPGLRTPEGGEPFFWASWVWCVVKGGRHLAKQHLARVWLRHQALTSSLPAFSCFLNFIYLSVAVLGLRRCTQTFSTCSEWWLLPHCGASASVCGGFSCCGVWTRRREDFGSCGTWTKFLLGMWDLLRPGIKPLCPALAGGFLITGPPGTSSPYIFTGINPFPHYYSRRRLGSIDC